MSSSIDLLRRSRTGPRVLALVVLVAAFLQTAPESRAATATITGLTYQDLDRDGTHDPQEPLFSGHQLYLFTGTGSFVAATLADATGRYAFHGLAEGSYRVEYDASSWAVLKHDWVPTTTGTLRPAIPVVLGADATADFGWRPITWSTTLGAPISTYVGSNGLRVQSYNDVVTANDVYNAVMKGWVGNEASRVSIRFGYGSTSATTSTTVQSGGLYTDFTAACYVSYESWLGDFDQTLGHEYGHAWSLYHATMVHQDLAFTSYLQARGLSGDPQLNTSYAWSVRELIAEDYRQLLGSPTAQTGAQANSSVPPAAQVPGLKDFFTTTFAPVSPSPAPGPTASPSPSITPTVNPTPAPSPTPPSTIQVLGLTVSPSPVKSSATIAFQLTTDAAVTLVILDAKGQIVSSLLENAPRPSGPTQVVWNRKDHAGRRVKAGEYRVSVVATSTAGASTTAFIGFLVA
jgi:hypothetical protein